MFQDSLQPTSKQTLCCGFGLHLGGSAIRLLHYLSQLTWLGKSYFQLNAFFLLCPPKGSVRLVDETYLQIHVSLWASRLTLALLLLPPSELSACPAHFPTYLFSELFPSFHLHALLSALVLPTYIVFLLQF